MILIRDGYELGCAKRGLVSVWELKEGVFFLTARAEYAEGWLVIYWNAESRFSYVPIRSPDPVSFSSVPPGCSHGL